MATTMRWNRKGLFATRLDGALPQASPEMAARLGAVGRVHDELAAEIEEAAGSEELTDLGKAEAVKRILARGQEALAPHVAEVSRLDAEAGDLRRRAAVTPAPEGSELRALFAEREIRDRLAGVDPLLLGSRYLGAIEKGDWHLVRAIENAPKAFSMVSGEVLRQGSDAKVAKSPLAPRLAEMEATRDVLRSIINAARAELDKLARGENVA